MSATQETLERLDAFLSDTEASDYWGDVHELVQAARDLFDLVRHEWNDHPEHARCGSCASEVDVASFLGHTQWSAGLEAVAERVLRHEGRKFSDNF